MTHDNDDPEGTTPLDPDDVEGLKFKHITTRGELNELEQANIQAGLIWLSRWLSRQNQLEVLTDHFASTLHQRLFGEVWTWAGTFRRTGTNIGVDPARISVDLRTLMDDARYWLDNDTYEPVEAAARLHHRMVYIHAFPNGNGRHARIMADTVLTRLYQSDPIDWTGGHDLQRVNDRRTDYIHAFRAADQGDYGPLLAFVRAGSH